MRGGYDTTCDLWTGPTGTPPDTLYMSDIPCRFIPQLLIVSTGFPDSLRAAWITLDAPAPNVFGATFPSPGHIDVDCNASDRIAIPSGSARQYAVYNVELVTPDLPATPYYRASVIALPFPTW